MPFHFVITVNTRAPRPGETHGVDYFFVTREEFSRMLAAGELIEHAQVYEDFKGVPRDQVQHAFASGKDVVMRLDVQGAATIRKLYPEALLIFILPESEEELIERLKSRHTESGVDLEKRIATAREELARVKEFDYMVVNAKNRLDEAVDVILAIIRAEHHRVTPRRVIL